MWDVVEQQRGGAGWTGRSDKELAEKLLGETKKGPSLPKQVQSYADIDTRVFAQCQVGFSWDFYYFPEMPKLLKFKSESLNFVLHKHSI